MDGGLIQWGGGLRVSELGLGQSEHGGRGLGGKDPSPLINPIDGEGKFGGF